MIEIDNTSKITVNDATFLVKFLKKRSVEGYVKVEDLVNEIQRLLDESRKKKNV